MKVRLLMLVGHPLENEIIVELDENCSIRQLIRKYLDSKKDRDLINEVQGEHGELLCAALVNSKYMPLDYILKDSDKVVIVPWIIGG